MNDNPSSPQPAKSRSGLTERRISELPPLTEAERHQLLVEWNDTQADYPRDRCIYELFEEQVERTPDAVAVVFEDEHLTYRELNRRANQLANYLRSLGVEPEVLVGTYVERSLEMVVGLLGILKAGGAYVPLDPAYPKERLTFMLKDAQTSVLLTRERLLKDLPEHEVQVVCLDTNWEAVAQEGEENLVSGATAENLAYVIYTSGSTGTPKGVCVAHRAVNRLVVNTNYAQLTSDDVVAQAANVAFDAATWEIWGALLNGARLVILPRDTVLSPRALAAEIEHWQISALWLTTALFNLVAREIPGAFRSLRHLLIGGEAVKPKWVREVLAEGAPGRLLNLYGPTETTTFATWHLVEAVEDGAATIPIGRPIANTKVYVLDARLQPAPIGVLGELYIGGPGVARGYLKRPELTAEKFIPDPFGDEPGARLYRTGDLVRYLPDGNIDFLGRLDHQVKIRGFRIELGEVEAVLSRHPDVRETVVVAREDAPEQKRLVAYIVPAQQQAPATSELRGFLKEELPEYMVPSAFVMLEALPLTPNGKVDRRALPAPKPSHPELDEAFVPPRTTLEQFLANSWQDVLGLERVGIHDNFFELGGDSSRADIFLDQLQQALGEAISIAAIFDAPTIAYLAVYLNQHYPDAVARLRGTEPPNGAESFARAGSDAAAPERPRRIDGASVAQMRRQIKPPSRRSKRGEAEVPKNPPAIFILSPPRSGSTLLRVILGGHPLLFAPPELELLSFDTLAERKAALTGRYSFWLEGTIRAIMALRGCDAEEAERTMENWESQGLTTAQCYRIMQTWMGGRTLVDKTTSYPFNLETLQRAEADFDRALYIHLPRHPWATIRSFEEAKLDRIFLGDEHSFSARELAESIWLMSHQNILEFLKGVPTHRQYRLKYEELVDQPRSVVEELCQFLGLTFHPDMLQPYGDQETRMTDGIHPLSKMLGDPKFHQHQEIDAEVADRWRAGDASEENLEDLTWQLAGLLGYERPDGPDGEFESSGGASTRKASAPIQPVARQWPDAAPERRRSDAPRDTLEERLAGIWEEVLGVPVAGMEYDFFELGGHSLLAANLFMQIEKAFGRRLPLSTLFQAPTVRQLANILRQGDKESLHRSIVEVQPSGSRPPFLCVHGAGREVLFLRPLAQHLGPDQPLYGSRRAWDEDKEQTIEGMAASYVRELREFQPKGPYFLGGFSGGGLVAFEMAQQLHTQGQDVALLALLDTKTPDVMHRREIQRQGSRERRRTGIQRKRESREIELRSKIQRTRERGLESRAKALESRLKGLESRTKVRESRAKALESFEEACVAYEPRPYPGRVTLFRVADPVNASDGLYLGWERFAAGGVEVYEVPGVHANFLKEPHVKDVAAKLKTCLDQARANSS